MRISNQRALFTTLFLGGLLTLVGCGSDAKVACEGRETRSFTCGTDRKGLQPQQCVDGIWETTSFCAMPDGTVHPEDPDFDPENPDAKPPVGKPDDKPGDKPGDKEDDPTVKRPTNPDGCVILKNTDVNGGKTLTDDDCYVAESTLTVNDGTLTIKPGVTILFKKDIRLVIRGEGRLNATGESGKMIWFHGSNDEKGFWAGIVFQDTGSGENVMDYVSVKGGGSTAFSGDPKSKGGIYVPGGAVKLDISNSTFEKNTFAGLHASNDASVVSVKSSTFKSNELPLRLRANHFSLLGDDLSFSDNKDADGEDANYIFMGGDKTYANKKGIWPGYTYRSENSFEITNAITIAPGATFQMMKETSFTIRGDDASMNAVGTADKPITFTSVANRRGSWRGLYFIETNSPDNKFEHVVIENAGDSQYTGSPQSRGALFISGDKVEIDLDNITFNNNEYSALTINDRNAKFTLGKATFNKNKVPMITSANHIGSFSDDITFDDNDNQAIIVNGTVTKDATWPTFSVPYEVDSTITIEAALTLSPKSTLKFHKGRGLTTIGTHGALIATAEGSDRITLEGITDVRGAWKGIHFATKNNINELDGVDLINPGDSEWTGSPTSKTGILLTGDARAIVNNTTVKGSGSYGVTVGTNARLVDCSGLTVTDSVTADFSGITGPSQCE